jgi:oxalate---CoA ligase
MSDSQLRRLIDEQSQRFPTEAFLQDARGERVVSFDELRQSAGSWRATLDAAELPERSNVLIDIVDPIAFSVTFLGVIAAGRCAVPIDPNAPDGEKARVRAAVRPALVVRSADVDSDVASAGIAVGDDGRPVIVARPARSLSGRDGALRLHTSGSTGEPKAVELSESQLLHVARQIAAHNRLAPGDRGYNSLPLFHINAEVVGVLASLVAGSTLVLDRKFQRRGFWQLMAQQHITWINSVPAMLAILAGDPLPARPDGLRFIRSASAPLPGSVRRAVSDAFGAVLIESYGMTEAASQITATALPPARSPDGSVGRPIGVELQIRTEDGSRASAGEVGRIWIRGDGVVTAYVGGRAAERFDEDGWLDTRDLGQLDVDGNVIHLGRMDDVINRGGELVHPREIEEVLLADDRVLDAAVVGRADNILGEVPVAYVVTRTAGAVLRAELMMRCETHLSRFKRPVEVVFVDDLPRAPTGKVLRSEVQRSEVQAARS